MKIIKEKDYITLKAEVNTPRMPLSQQRSRVLLPCSKSIALGHRVKNKHGGLNENGLYNLMGMALLELWFDNNLGVNFEVSEEAQCLSWCLLRCRPPGFSSTMCALCCHANAGNLLTCKPVPTMGS